MNPRRKVSLSAVVPQGVQARLGVFNAKEFLETGKYVDLQEARKAQGGRKSKVVLVRRTTKR